MFSSKSFTVSGLTFRSLIHFEFIFVYGVRKCSNFILLHVAVQKYLETNDNENMMTQNLWDAAKAVLRGKFIAIQSYLKKQEKSQINNLTSHLKQLEKEEQENLKVSRRKEIIKIRSEINEKEMKEIAKINKIKSWFFEKINKIDKPLARLIKKKGGDSNQQN